MPLTQRFLRGFLILICLLVCLPVLLVFGAWLAPGADSGLVLQHLAKTVLPGYLAQSALLAVAVALGVVLLGGATAAAVTLFDFPGRRWLEWALLLPLAMPAYVLAYAWTDALQYSGPIQSALRALLGVRTALWPDVRSLPFAAVLFVLCLYPYVYLLTRAALAERAVRLMEAARSLGAPLRRRVLEVALPMARPAIAAGTALALMETLADYGVGSYFGLGTFSTGIYKAWLVMNDRTAAAQLAALLLAIVACLLWVERRAQRRMRFGSARPSAAAAEAQPLVLGGLAGWALAAGCLLPVLLGFALPVAWMLWLLGQEAATSELGLPMARFAHWAWTSFSLAALAALLALALALALAFCLRQGRSTPLAASAGVISLGYAVPGAVIAVGILFPLGWVQSLWPQAGASAWLTGTVLGLLVAYVLRFSSVALQTVEAGYARVPQSIDETARTLGTGTARLFTRLHLPLLARSTATALLLVFVDVMKELPATLVLRPFGSDTLAVVAYNLARDERLAEAALPCLAIVAVGLVPVLLVSRTLRRPDR